MKKVKLKNIAPTLSNLKEKGTGFVIPDGYLDDFGLNTLKIQLTDALKNSGSSEFELPTQYFSTLEDIVVARLMAESMDIDSNKRLEKDYFDTLEDKVIAQIDDQKSVFSRSTLVKRVVPAIAIAASVLLIFNIFSDSNVGFDQLDTADIDAWIATEADLDTENLLAIFEDIDLDGNLLTAEFSDDEMIEFLSDEQLDDDWLYEN